MRKVKTDFGRAMTIITTFLTPYLIKIGWKVVENRGSGDRT
jgi:hypothetical protein